MEKCYQSLENGLFYSNFEGKRRKGKIFVTLVVLIFLKRKRLKCANSILENGIVPLTKKGRILIFEYKVHSPLGF